MQIFILFEVILAITVLVIVLLLPEAVFERFRRCSFWLSRVAARPGLSVTLVGVIALAASAAFSFFVGIPEPRVHDEFSYLFAGDTFARGRLTNPTHPLWVHFETFHIVQQPTYASKFPPAQGLILATGRLIGGHPIVGVWGSVGLACGAICWMLQAWLPRRWALFGALLCILQVRFYHSLPYLPAGILGYWSQSYWGGAAATFGGALVFGALPRIVRRPRAFEAVLLGLGLAILANSRPFEGLVASVPAMVWLLVWLVRKNGFPRSLLFWRVVLPIVIVLVVTAGTMGFYNFRITSDPLRFPYLLHEETYSIAPLFFLQKPRPQKTYNHEIIRAFHTDWELTPYLRQQSASGLLEETGKKVATLWDFYLGPVLTIPLAGMLPFVWRNKRMQFPLATCGLLTTTLLLVNWVFPHYGAPITGLVLLLVVQAIRHLRLWSWKGRPIGRRLVYAIPCTLAASLLLFFALRIKFPSYDWSHQRAQIMTQLNRQEGRHLVIVRYVKDGPGYFRSHPEWVYNEPDIDNAKVVWAREMDGLHNRKLLEYFRHRHVWLLIFDERKSADLLPYSRATDL